MTAFEIVSTILAAASLMIAAGMFVIALLAFLDQRNKHK
ncbi:putative holin-like toxin [Butyricicoccus sp.]